MIHRVFASMRAVTTVMIVVGSLVPVPVTGPTSLASFVGVVEASGGAQGPATTTGAAADTWTVPRTADGQPDLQGVWANNSATPLERPKQVANRKFFTDEELAELRKIADQIVANDGDAQFGDGLILAALDRIAKPGSYDPATGNYNQFWLVEREFDDRRTSLVVDPPDGRIPPLTPEAKTRQAAAAEYSKLHPADGPEDRPAGERCVNFGIPKIGAGYNSYYQIFQSPGHVAILSEMAHDVRIIPLDRRAHLDKTIRQWNGDARGHWEGNTLVVETTNFSPKSEFRAFLDTLSQENMHLVERFTRVGPNTLNYEFAITDATTWTRPWTVMIPLKASSDKIYEYACHEGNEGMVGILAGHRAQEKAEEAAKKKSN
jgi:hypothetical protein